MTRASILCGIETREVMSGFVEGDAVVDAKADFVGKELVVGKIVSFPDLRPVQHRPNSERELDSLHQPVPKHYGVHREHFGQYVQHR